MTKAGEEGKTYDEIKQLRMFVRKKNRLAKFTKNRERNRRNGGYCSCCGRGGYDYDYDY